MMFQMIRYFYYYNVTQFQTKQNFNYFFYVHNLKKILTIIFNIYSYINYNKSKLYCFLIQFIIKGKMIHWILIDEGASTCIMFVSCWKSIGSQPLNQPPNTLEAIDGKGSRLILTNFPITLEGKTIDLEVEVVDANLNYNLLLG